ncbi:CD1375 family protein [Brevibacillus panacihumi]
MAAVYYRLILRGLKTIDDVPQQDKAAVQALLDADQR